MHWDRFTPAVYGIIRKVPKRTIQNWWTDLVHPVLLAESQGIIYICAARAIALARLTSSNQDCGYKIFHILLEDADFPPLASDVPTDAEMRDFYTISLEAILDAVFDTYWGLAEDGYFGDLRLVPTSEQASYEEAMESWESQKGDIIQQYEETVKQWSTKN